MITLTLTDEQAEILGYALSKTAREQRKVAADARPRGMVEQGCRKRIALIEEVRDLLDAAAVEAEKVAA